MAGLPRRGENSVSDRFGDNDLIAGFGPGVREEEVRMRPPRNCQAVLQLGIDNGVPADNQRSGFVHFLLTAGENFSQHLERQLAGRKRDDVECRHWLAAHGVDIGQRICRGDLTEIERIVDNRREEIHCLYQRDVVGQAKDPSIVERLAADEQSWISLFRKRGQRAG